MKISYISFILLLIITAITECSNQKLVSILKHTDEIQNDSVSKKSKLSQKKVRFHKTTIRSCIKHPPYLYVDLVTNPKLNELIVKKESGEMSAGAYLLFVDQCNKDLQEKYRINYRMVLWQLKKQVKTFESL